MKKLATIVFGLFLVATSFANVTPIKTTAVKTQETVKTTVLNTPKTNTLINQINKVMTLTTVAAIGPRGVVQSCATRCQDSL